MSYADAPWLPLRILRGVGYFLGAVCFLLILGLLAFSIPARSAEYLLFNTDGSTVNHDAERTALRSVNNEVGCELLGKPVERDGRPALRFRFPTIDPKSDADSVQCIRSVMPPGYALEEQPWLTSKLHEWAG